MGYIMTNLCIVDKINVDTVEDLDEEEVSDIDITAIPDIVLAERGGSDGRPMWVADCKGLCRRCRPECFKACECCNMAETPLGPYRVKLFEKKNNIGQKIKF